ncbi:PIF1-like protein [Mya arenaria]|uniref:ATP-dependent DNA helicase n=1 Tax=Mya arenaria TaxID=6604 RepID=A0ABY7EIU9_MYAAR|nr:PIF1-like protein [Mya arenaria]
MNKLQQAAIDISLEGHNLLLLGSAGTGKSFVVNEIAKQLKARGKTVQITCSTGIACNVYKENACTIHQFTGISDGRYGPTEIVDVLKNNPKYDYVIDNINKVDTVILDECSMISEQVFNTILQVFQMKDPSAIFGGVQIIFCGDFFQLPPVANTSYGDTGKYCFQSKYFKSVFPHRVILTETIRQNEESFIKAINEISHGKSSQESEQFILELSRPLTLQEGSRSVKLFSRNDYVDDYNRKCLINFPGTIFEFQSTDTGRAKDLAKITAPRLLWIKKSCPVILLRNLSKTLVNGLSGYVSEVDDSGPVINFPSVNLVTRIPKELNKDIAVREQYPLKLGFGITIHKAQGMTLTSVEVDCRDIFKAGQLAVAMSRATTSSGLRVINFHPRYIIPPPQFVIEFMNEPSQATTPDISCCRAVKSLTCDDGSDFKETTECPEDNEDQPQIEDVDIEATEDIENLDDDFNRIIASIISIEAEAIEFEIPEQFNITTVIENMKYEKEVTENHKCINEILDKIHQPKLSIFVKKIFLKFAEIVTKLTGNKKSSTGVPEACLAKYYRLSHEFTTSADYTLSCIDLFGDECSFSDHHRIVCYNIVEAVRLFFLKQKVDLLKITKGNVPKRQVTDASRARIRYVAGYCLASLRKKYTKIQHSYLYSKTKEGQDSEAKCTVSILNTFKEEEH